MNQQEAEAVKGLARDTIKALEVIVEKECSLCKSYGKYKIVRTSPHRIVDPCDKCNGTGKVKQKWEPEIFDLYYFPVGNGKIRSIDETTQDDATVLNSAIPILYWEKIEKVLEGAGYYLSWGEPCNCERCRAVKSARYVVSIVNPTYQNLKSSKGGKTRQEAVMRAVIKLGEGVR